MTIRDFLSHRSGVAPDNLIFWGTELERAEIVRRIRYRGVSGFRSSFQYNNLTYSALGEVILTASGKSWGDCVRDRIFDGLGMDQPTVRNRDFAGDPNMAAAHMEIAGVVRQQPRQDGDNIAPAGAIYSSATDMARWILFHLGDAVIDDREILPPDIVREMRTLRTSTAPRSSKPSSPGPTFTRTAWGGRFTRDSWLPTLLGYRLYDTS